MRRQLLCTTSLRPSYRSSSSLFELLCKLCFLTDSLCSFTLILTSLDRRTSSCLAQLLPNAATLFTCRALSPVVVAVVASAVASVVATVAVVVDSHQEAEAATEQFNVPPFISH